MTNSGLYVYFIVVFSLILVLLFLADSSPFGGFETDLLEIDPLLTLVLFSFLAVEDPLAVLGDLGVHKGSLFIARLDACFSEIIEDFNF